MAVELTGYRKPAFDVRFGYLTLEEDIISGKVKITVRESCRTLQRARDTFTFYLFKKKRIRLCRNHFPEEEYALIDRKI